MHPRPALKRLYSIAGRVLSIHTFDDWSTSAVSKLVDGWFIRPLESDGPAHVTLKISSSAVLPEIPPNLSTFEISDAGICHTDQRVLYLEFDRGVIKVDSPSEVGVWINRPEDLDQTTLSRVLSQAFSAALRRCGLFEFHSGAVVPPDAASALLIAGPSGSGKSTLTASLAECGWSYLSDDTVLLRNDVEGIQTIALRQFFALTPTTIATLPAIRTRSTGNGRKSRFRPQEFFSGKQIESAKPAVILFTTITREPATSLQKLSQSETMSRVLKLCPWACYDSISAGDHLRLLGRLGRETVSFDILAGTDLLQNPHLASDLVYRTFSRD